MSDQQENARFENEVRRVARALYPNSASGEAAIHTGRERDGVFLTDQVVVVIEATVSRKKEKVADDAKKTVELIRELRSRYPDHTIIGQIVTREPPTAEQAEAVKKYASYQVRVISFDHFRSKLLDGTNYLQKRDNYAFGSARGQDGSIRIDETRVIPLDIIARNGAKDAELLSIDDLSERFVLSEAVTRAILVGDFGAGKSTSLHAVYRRSSDAYRKGKGRLPILLNLRDHAGQTDPVEAIERHARRIGFESPSKLVAAFWAEELALLLDGFDELTPF